jgi:hypothetical protein
MKQAAWAARAIQPSWERPTDKPLLSLTLYGSAASESSAGLNHPAHRTWKPSVPRREPLKVSASQSAFLIE